MGVGDAGGVAEPAAQNFRETRGGLLSTIPWMDEILHHLRNPGMIRFPYVNAKKPYGFPWS